MKIADSDTMKEIIGIRCSMHLRSVLDEDGEAYARLEDDGVWRCTNADREGTKLLVVMPDDPT